MKTAIEKLAFAGANLLALAAHAKNAPVTSATEAAPAGHTQITTETEARLTEAAHLRVPNACKWGHAAFEPVRVTSETLSAEVSSLHAQMEIA